MNHCVIQQNSLAQISDRRDSVVCPKPRRLGVVSNDSVRDLRWHLMHSRELLESKARKDLHELILSKGGGCGSDQLLRQISSSPPFFSGSPPSRAANPLVQDARFREENPVQLSLLPISTLSPSPTSSKKGCFHAKSGHITTLVRIEGFNCKDRRSCSIPAVA